MRRTRHVLWSVLAGGVAAAAPPAGFVNEVVLEGLTQPTSLAFLPDGRVLVLETCSPCS